MAKPTPEQIRAAGERAAQYLRSGMEAGRRAFRDGKPRESLTNDAERIGYDEAAYDAAHGGVRAVPALLPHRIRELEGHAVDMESQGWKDAAETLRALIRAHGVIVTGEAQQPGETYLAYLARCEREGRNPKPQAKDQDLCREPGCTNPTKTPVSAWCREHDRAGGFPHA